MVIIIEDNKPQFVAMSFRAFEQLNKGNQSSQKEERLDEVNSDLSSVGEDINNGADIDLVEMLDDSDEKIKIEDLPF